MTGIDPGQVWWLRDGILPGSIIFVRDRVSTMVNERARFLMELRARYPMITFLSADQQADIACGRCVYREYDGVPILDYADEERR